MMSLPHVIMVHTAQMESSPAQLVMKATVAHLVQKLNVAMVNTLLLELLNVFLALLEKNVLLE